MQFSNYANVNLLRGIFHFRDCYSFGAWFSALAGRRRRQDFVLRIVTGSIGQRSVGLQDDVRSLRVGSLHDDGRVEIKRAALGDIVNLKRFRKALARKEADRQAAENRAVFGQSRAERERIAREKQQLNDAVDRHRIEDEDR